MSTMEEWTVEIKKAMALFMQYYKARDFKAIANLYTEECRLMPPGMKLGKDRQAVIDVISSFASMGGDSVTFSTAEVIPANDTAVERGNFVLSRADGSVLDKGKYMVVWKRVGDEVKLYMDMWNSDIST